MKVPKNKKTLTSGHPDCHKVCCVCRLNQKIVDRDYLDLLIHSVGIEFVAYMKDMADATMVEESPYEIDWYFEATGE